MIKDPFRCPTCNARQELSSECRRCKCDLSLLVAVRQQCDQLHAECLHALRDDNADTAEQLALRLWELSPDEDAARLLGVTYLRQGRFQAAIDVGKLSGKAEV